jgi:hypothetical protein
MKTYDKLSMTGSALIDDIKDVLPHPVMIDGFYYNGK